ncbi:MAG: hypothetical protein ACXAB4_13385 [Candidatus Hodarchaeales archaeon]|jgi:hypothetical protein
MNRIKLVMLGLILVAFGPSGSKGIAVNADRTGSFSQNSSSIIYTDGLATNSYMQWEITEYNEALVADWWNLTSDRGAFRANIGSLVNFTIAQAQPQNLSSTYKGILEFGNLSLMVDNAETGSNLVLSVYPWLPGLITHTNWTWHKAQAQTGLGVFVNGTLSILDTTTEILGVEREAVIFAFEQDKPGNQNTTLFYDKDTGVLLKADTEVRFASLFRMSLILKRCKGLSAASPEAEWMVKRYNEDTTLSWYSDSYAHRANVSVVEKSLLKFTFEGSEDFALWGNIEFGNFSGSVSNNEIASNLALGIWPWNPGLFVSEPWQTTVLKAQNAAQGFGVLSIKNSWYHFDNANRNSKIFDFKQNAPGNQNTTLIFDAETGILLKATTEFTFNVPYFLELELESSPILLQDNISENTSDEAQGLCFLFSLIAISALIIRRRHVGG